MVLQIPYENTRDLPKFPIGAAEKSHDNDSEEEKRKKISRLKKFGVAGLAAITILGGGIAIGANVSAQEQAPPVATEPAEPNEPNMSVLPVTIEESEPKDTLEAEDELSYEQQVAALEIPTGLSIEELADTFVNDRLTQWLNAGAKDSLIDDSIEANQSWDNFLPPIAEENAEVFAEALFIDGWQQNPDLAKEVKSIKSTNLNVLECYTSTQWSDKPENIEGYKRWYTVDSAEETPNSESSRYDYMPSVERTRVKGERAIKITITQNNNHEMNIYEPFEDPTFTYIVTFREVEGTEKISAIRFIDDVI